VRLIDRNQNAYAAYERSFSKIGDDYFRITRVKTYLIQVLVKPGKAFFESMVKSSNNKRHEIIGDTHLPGLFWHVILPRVKGFFENFEKSLLHAILL
jgi:hypothetical protein